MSKHNADHPLFALDGKTPFGPFPTIRAALLAVLDGAPMPPPVPGQPPDVRGQKLARHALLVRIRAGGEIDLSPADVALLDALAASMLAPNIYGQVWDWLGKPK